MGDSRDKIKYQTNLLINIKNKKMEKKNLIVTVITAVLIILTAGYSLALPSVQFILEGGKQASGNRTQDAVLINILVKNTNPAEKIDLRYVQVYADFPYTAGTISAEYVSNSTEIDGWDASLSANMLTKTRMRLFQTAAQSPAILSPGETKRIGTVRITGINGQAFDLSKITIRTNDGGFPKTKAFIFNGTNVAALGPASQYSYSTQLQNGTKSPVELASFTSSVNAKDVKLIWSTSNEEGNKNFDVERKLTSESDWKKLGSVEGKNTPSAYAYEDAKLSPGKYNYRLKQNGSGGESAYFNLDNTVEIGVPSKFALQQNYPNPFNPKTKINFDLPEDSRVRILVYDMTGREVMTLVNEIRTAGYHSYDFDAGSVLSSGTYFYRMIANANGKEVIFTKKMVLVK